jgi:hypothetical protein
VTFVDTGAAGVGIAPVIPSGDAGIPDTPESERPATGMDEGSHPVGGNGEAGHGGDTDPNRGSFM